MRGVKDENKVRKKIKENVMSPRLREGWGGKERAFQEEKVDNSLKCSDRGK